MLSLEVNLDVVGEAASGEDTLEQLGDPLPDLFLIDFSLPGMDGAQLIKMLLEKNPDARCLVISSHHETFYVSKALSAGAHGYVSKGNPEVLIRAISGVLKGKTVVETQL